MIVSSAGTNTPSRCYELLQHHSLQVLLFWYTPSTKVQPLLPTPQPGPSTERSPFWEDTSKDLEMYGILSDLSVLDGPDL